MKFLLILTLTALWTAAAYASSSEENRYETLTSKEKIRVYLAHNLQQLKNEGFESSCPRQLTPEQIVFGNQQIDKFVECGNATIDIFVDKLDDNVDIDKLENLETVPLYAKPLCEVFDNIFRCIRELNPVIDMCLDDSEKIFKNKLFAVVPLIHQSVCLRDGAIIAEIVEHADGIRCISSTIDIIFGMGLFELFVSDSDELFGDGKVCQSFNDVLRELYKEVGECSVDVLEKVKDMIGFFCDGTRCDRFIHDLKCY